MIDQESVARAAERFKAPDGALERLIRRRDRKRRNQRIAAGVVGIAVFAAAVWIVTTAGSFDRTQTPAATGPAATGPAETGPVGRPAPPLAHAPAAPDVVGQRMCSDGAGSRLELTKVDSRIKVRFEVYRSPVGHEWRIAIRHGGGGELGSAIFRGVRMSSDSGQLAVELRRVPWGQSFHPRFTATAVDTQTGQACRVDAQW